jgi:DNA-binding LacI/PurR family transcriptional regulator
MEQLPYLMGKTAGEMLLRKISLKRRTSKKVVIPSRLIRSSTAKVTAERR